MQELHCKVCNKIIGFVSHKAEKRRGQDIVYKCIDCYFSEIKDLIKQNSK